RRYQGFIQPNVSANAVIKRGPSTFNLSAGTGFNKQFEEGTDTQIDTATGDLVERNRVTLPGAPAHDDNLIQDYSDPLFELGGDVTRPLAGGAIKFVGLATRRKRDDVDTYIQRDGLIDENG